MTARHVAVAFLAGVLGMAAAGVVYQMYVDHVRITMVWNALQRPAPAAQAPK